MSSHFTRWLPSVDLVYFVARFGPFCGVDWYPFNGENWYTLSYHLQEDAARDIIQRFQEKFGVPKEALEKYIGRKAEAFTVQSINRLRGVYTALKDGTASVEQYFDMSADRKSVV